jgi:hypothetical protein
MPTQIRRLTFIAEVPGKGHEKRPVSGADEMGDTFFFFLLPVHRE